MLHFRTFILVSFSTILVNKSVPVVVQDLCEDAGVSVKEVLVEDGVVVSERLCEPRQTRGWDLLERCFVRFMSDPPHVQDHAVLRVHINQVHLGAGCNITDIYQYTYRSNYTHTHTHKWEHFELKGKTELQLCLFS